MVSQRKSKGCKNLSHDYSIIKSALALVKNENIQEWLIHASKWHMRANSVSLLMHTSLMLTQSRIKLWLLWRSSVWYRMHTGQEFNEEKTCRECGVGVLICCCTSPRVWPLHLHWKFCLLDPINLDWTSLSEAVSNSIHRLMLSTW